MPALKQIVMTPRHPRPHPTARSALALAGRTLDGLNTKYEARERDGRWYAVALLRPDQDWMRLSLLERGLMVEDV